MLHFRWGQGRIMNEPIAHCQVNFKSPICSIALAPFRMRENEIKLAKVGGSLMPSRSLSSQLVTIVREITHKIQLMLHFILVGESFGKGRIINEPMDHCQAKRHKLYLQSYHANHSLSLAMRVS